MAKLIGILWLLFWVYWLALAAGSKKNIRNFSWGAGAVVRLVGLVVIYGIIILFAKLHTRPFTPNKTSAGVGLILFFAGIGIAVWARRHLGRNWGMPMTQKKSPELVTTGPYHWVRHPIYSGILLAILGSGLAVGEEWLVALLGTCIYFIYSAVAEERLMLKTFPASYPAYKSSTKMLIPFVL